MVNSTLLQLVGNLNLSEFRDFGEYIRCPYFNKNESVIKLYEYLKIFYPDFSGKKFEKEFVYGKLYPELNYDDAFMRKVMFNLSKLAEDYLAYKYFIKNKFQYYECLLNDLESRNLDRLFQKKLKIMEDEFNKVNIKDTAYYEIKSKIDSFRNYYIMKNTTFVNVKDKPGAIFDSEMSSLINFFLVRIIDKYRFFFNFKKMLRYDFKTETAFYEAIIDYMKKNEHVHNSPLLTLYFNSLMLVIEKDESYFKKTKEVLIREMDSLSYLDKYSTLALLVNYSSDEYYNGKKKYLAERHELQKMILENKLISGFRPGGFFNDALFKNIVSVGLLLKEIKWTEEFINTYIGKVEPSQKDSVLNLHMARVNFEKKNYEEALEQLSKINSVSHFYYKPAIKSLTLRIYIEKGWYDQAYDLIDAFKHYMSNDKMMPDFQKEKNNNFLKFCNEIIKLASGASKEKSDLIKHELLNTNNILEKEWLMEKIRKFKM